MSELVAMLNPVLSSVSTGMNKGLNIKENLNIVEKDITITVPDFRWETPVLAGAWANYAGNEEVAGYRIDDDGVVHVKGIVKDGAGTVFTLPVGYRPAKNVRFAVDASSAFGAVVVQGTDGVVSLVVGANTYVSLNFSFEATTPVGSPAFTGGGWPLLVDSGQPSPILDVKLGSVTDMNGTTNTSNGGAGIHWEPGPAGKVIIRRVTRLTPGRQYKLKLLLYPT
jgi:hypothetical protein